jgi:hypothetical protein
MYYAELPKWSRMVITGDNVTKEQAKEIIVRTDDFNFSSNDVEWKKELYQSLNIPLEGQYCFPDHDKLKEVSKEMGLLNIYYLCNNQIASCSILGPHGWCSWEGNIGCDYNIGKYPSIENVLKELELIAGTWKFLNMKCQLWNGECFEDEISPIVEFTVNNGKVIVGIPTKYETKEFPISNLKVLEKNGERGCSINTFNKAINIVKEKLSGEEREFSYFYSEEDHTYEVSGTFKNNNVMPSMSKERYTKQMLLTKIMELCKRDDATTNEYVANTIHAYSLVLKKFGNKKYALITCI